MPRPDKLAGGDEASGTGTDDRDFQCGDVQILFKSRFSGTPEIHSAAG